MVTCAFFVSSLLMRKDRKRRISRTKKALQLKKGDVVAVPISFNPLTYELFKVESNLWGSGKYLKVSNLSSSTLYFLHESTILYVNKIPF